MKVRILCSVLLAASMFSAATAAQPSPLRLVLTPHAGATAEDLVITREQQRLRETGVTGAGLERLGWAYVTKARRTQDAGFYKLAELTAQAMEQFPESSSAARLLHGHALHNQHRFHEAEEIARELVRERGGALDYALWSDTLVELGRLDEAVRVCQDFCNLLPGLEAYSRVAYLRWLHGDLRGATRAMELAVAAGGSTAKEPLAWALVRLARYRLQAGEAREARVIVERALELVPDLASAWLTRGQIALALHEPADAVHALEKSETLHATPETQWWLADALRLTGDEDAARVVETKLRARGRHADPRTTALFLATRGEDLDTAVDLARTELTTRADAHSHDALAWARAARGDWTEAQRNIAAALQTGPCDPRLFLHAAVIADALDDTSGARAWRTRATSFANLLTPSERTLLAAFGPRDQSAPFSSQQKPPTQ